MSCASPAALAEKVQLRFEGETLPSDVRDAVRAGLTDENRPETLFEARRQAERAENTVRDILNSRGYFDPQITAYVETNEVTTPVLEVEPGKLFLIEILEIDYSDAEPNSEAAQDAFDAITLAAGDTAIPAEIIDAEREISFSLRRNGYAFAEAGDRRVQGDREAGELRVTYNVSAGHRVRLGEVIYPDDIITETDYLDRLRPFEAGDLYTPQGIAMFSGRLSETRLFDLANVRLAEEPTRIMENGDAVYDVIVTLSERERNTVALGASIATDVGPGVTAEFTRRNLTKNGDLLVAELTVAQLEQELDVQWRRPNEFGYGRGLVLSTTLSNENTDGFDSQEFAVGAGYEVVEGPDFSYSYGVTASLIHEQDEFGERDLQLLGVYASARLDRADDFLNPTKGWRVEGRVDPNVALGSSESQFIRAEGQLRGYLPFGEDRRLVLAGRLKLGTVWGADIEALPSDDRFFSGGGGSVRGYAYQAIGPRSDDDAPLGGRALLETSVEARWQFRQNIGLVGFIDAGRVSETELPSFSDLRFGAGFGVRYDTPAGPLRVDIATPLDPTDFDDPVQIYIALGQAF